MMKTIAPTRNDATQDGDVLFHIRRRIKEVMQEFREVNEQLAAVRERHGGLEAKLAELQRQEAYWAAETGETVSAAEPRRTDAADRNQHAGMTIPYAHRLPYADLAKRLLELEHRPLKTHEITELMAEQGHFPAADSQRLRGAIYSSLARRKREFLRTRDGFWGLVGRDEDQPPRLPLGSGGSR